MTLSAEQPFAQAAAEIVCARTAAVFRFERRAVLDIGDIEGVHDMRVATRRLRASLEVFGAAFDRKRGKRALHGVKVLAEALGQRRDRDVQLALLAEQHERCGGAERRAVELLAQELRAEQEQANAELAKALARARLARLQRRLERLTR